MPALFVDAVAATQTLKINRASLYSYVSRGLVRTRVDAGDPRRRLYSAEDIARLSENKRRGRKSAAIAAATLDGGMPTLESRITLIENGAFYYRGVNAATLATKATLEETARLLWDCGDADPFEGKTQQPDQAWNKTAQQWRDVPAIERCLALIPLSGIGQRVIWQHQPSQLWTDAAGLLRTVAAAMTASAWSDEPVHRALARAWRLDKKGAELVRAALVLCADHELNASAFAARVIASTGASLAACLAGGLGALSGPMHGGTTSLVEILFDETEQSGSAQKVVQERLRRGDRLPGFGHPLYLGGDARAQVLLQLLPKDTTRNALVAAIESVGGKAPNIDFALVALRRALRLPRGSALMVFAVGRSVGWIAHALEQQQSGKLIRPRAHYIGPAPQP